LYFLKHNCYMVRDVTYEISRTRGQTYFPRAKINLQHNTNHTLPSFLKMLKIKEQISFFLLTSPSLKIMPSLSPPSTPTATLTQPFATYAFTPPQQPPPWSLHRHLYLPLTNSPSLQPTHRHTLLPQPPPQTLLLHKPRHRSSHPRQCRHHSRIRKLPRRLPVFPFRWTVGTWPRTWRRIKPSMRASTQCFQVRWVHPRCNNSPFTLWWNGWEPFLNTMVELRGTYHDGAGVGQRSCWIQGMCHKWIQLR